MPNETHGSMEGSSSSEIIGSLDQSNGSGNE
jgi:hypothetical protein